MGENPAGIVVNSKSSKAYAAIMGDNQLVEIDLRRGQVSRFVFKGRTPIDVKLDPSDRYLYVAYLKEDQVGKIDLKERKILERIDVGKEPVELYLSKRGRYLYVASQKGKSVSKIRTDDMSLIQEVKLPQAPNSLAFDQMTSQLWVGMESSLWIYQDIHIKPVTTYSPNPFLSSEGVEGNEVLSQEIEEPSQNRHQEEEGFEEEIELDAPLTYHIIVGSFQSYEPAQRRLNILKMLGYKDCLVLEPTDGRFRISCAQYDSREQAEIDLPEFQEKVDPKAWILTK